MSQVIEFYSAASRKPNKSRGASPLRSLLSSCENKRKCRDGILPSDFQLLMADLATPASEAAAELPPMASITSSTERMSLTNSENLYMSSIQYFEIEKNSVLRCSSVGSVDMGTTEEVMARVRQLPEILGKSDSELAQECGVTPQQWSNYKAEGRHNNELPWRCALILWNSCGIPMQWIYDGQTTSHDLVPEMREKLALAERRAQAWLAGRRRGRSKSGMAHIAILTLAGAFLLSACTTAGQVYKRMDGARIDQDALSGAKLVCRGEATKANLAAGQNAALGPETFGYSNAMTIVYRGCLADHGYLPIGGN